MSNEPLRPVDLLFPQARRAESIDAATCVAPPFGCGEPVDLNSMPADDFAEYRISGLCSACQLTVFAD